MTPNRYEVIVGNIGKVHEGGDVIAAKSTFKIYKFMSQNNVGRGAGESVDFYKNGELLEQFTGALKEAEMEFDYKGAKHEMLQGRLLRRKAWSLNTVVSYDTTRNCLCIWHRGDETTRKKFISTDEEQHAADWVYADLNLA
jgi:hypothetical protein